MHIYEHYYILNCIVLSRYGECYFAISSELPVKEFVILFIASTIIYFSCKLYANIAQNSDCHCVYIAHSSVIEAIITNLSIGDLLISNPYLLFTENFLLVSCKIVIY